MENILVPELGESIIEGTLTAWLVKENESFKSGDNLAEIETDKITIEIPAQSDGIITKILIQSGGSVKVGQVIAEFEKSSGSSGEKIIDKEEVKIEKEEMVKKQQSVEKNEIKITNDTSNEIPNFDRDINSKKEKRIPMSKLRQTIAKRLKDAQNTAAILTTFNEVDMTEIMKLRKSEQSKFQKKNNIKLGFMSFFIKASIKVLKEIPEINSEIHDNEIIYKNYFDLGIAIGSEKGLVVPIIRGVDSLSFAEIEKKIVDLANKVNTNKLSMSDLSGGTFSITNGGVYGSMMSTPIINPPQSAILGMHSITDRPMAIKNKVVIRPMMYVALSYDHRLVDGKQAVTFLVRLKEILENPNNLYIN
ncbi:MAG: dihydrolipoyllysine-residue succinyltransferase [Alphaproteobacteria bacterium]|jgi:2-oxoglutarate dehydrogenase E2 component (dihydrolipoamide succinyltransferase)|tara:strand:- start:3093 stop:4178 length:1086 start_codon:yes stop_codon:yes gene_type:complete